MTPSSPKKSIAHGVSAELRSHPWRDAVAGAMPAFVLLLFAGRLGSFHGGAGALETTLGLLVVATMAVLGAWRGGADPLLLRGLGSLRMVVPLLAFGLVACSVWFSPMRRAGTLALCYVPWLLLGVGSFRGCLHSETRRLTATASWASVLIVLSCWALWDWLILGSPRAAMPMGHHNLQALILVVLLPLGVLPVLWQQGMVAAGREAASRAPRWLSGLTLLAAGLGLLALLATRSLAGALGFAVQVVWVAWRAPGPDAVRNGRRWAGSLLAAATVLAVGWRRLLEISRGEDPSFNARWEYLQGAWAAVLERPVLGWGPGAGSWTLGRFVDSGRLQAGQVVTDAHSLPFDLLMELGWLGAAGVLALLVMYCSERRRWSLRWREGVAEQHSIGLPWDPAERAALRSWASVATVAFVGLSTASIAAGWFDVSALWLGLTVVVGLRLAAEAELDRVDDRRSLPLAAAAALLAVLAIQPVWAHWLFDRLQSEADPAARRALWSAAVARDPEHPLLLADAPAGGAEAEADSALRAAEHTQGLAVLWLEAGRRLASLDDPRAQSALVRACDLSVHDALAPYLLARTSEPGRGGPESLPLQAMGRALLGAPALLASPELLARPDLRRRVVQMLDAYPAIPLGWRAALVEAEAVLPDAPVRALDSYDLVKYRDEEGEVSLSLFAFRRRSERVEIARASVDARAAGIAMPPLHHLPAVDFERVLADGCRLASHAD